MSSNVEKNENYRGNTSGSFNLFIYTTVFLLLLCSRIFDVYTTYLATPDLARESNFVVRAFGFGWMNLLIMNIVIITVFFLLFTLSWSRYQKWHVDRQEYTHSSIGGFIHTEEQNTLDEPGNSGIQKF